MKGTREEQELSGQELTALAEWAAQVTVSNIPPYSLERARWVLLDNMGAMIGGNAEAEVAKVSSRLLANRSQGKATVLGAGFPTTDSFTAAEINGIACCWLELDEGCSLGAHAGLYILPALLALAEETGAAVGDVLQALVAGYEVGVRLSEAWELRPMAMHKHGVFPAMTAAAACCNLLRADAATTLKAMATAAALTVASPYDQSLQGALVRNLWSGIGASLGLKALVYAEAGIEGLPTTMHSTFHRVYGAAYQAGRLQDRLGERFAIDYGWHKAYACCHDIHSILEAMFEIRKRHFGNGEAPSPASIIVYTNDKTLSMNDAHPRTTLGAKFSIPHAVSAVWQYGEAGRWAFLADTLHDPGMVRLRNLVRIEAIDSLAYPHKGAAYVVVHFENGQMDEASASYALGDLQHPFTERMLGDKFAQITAGIVPNGGQVAQTLLNFPLTAPFSEFMHALKAT